MRQSSVELRFNGQFVCVTNLHVDVLGLGDGSARAGLLGGDDGAAELSSGESGDDCGSTQFASDSIELADSIGRDIVWG